MNKSMRQLFLLIFSFFMLTSCAVVAIGAAGAVVGTTAVVATDPRLSGTVVNDNKIETKLKFIYSDYENANIYVNSYNGVILLTGQVQNKKMKESAVFEAKVTPGVKKIYDFMEIRLPQSFAAISEDSYTTTQVRGKIFTIKGINSNTVKVITTNNVVYLLGIVSQSQAQDVAKAAASINGVSKVVTLFEYSR